MPHTARSLLCFSVHLRVDPGPNEQKIDDHIQPQNNQNDRRQRAVDIRQTPEMQDVKREHTGEDQHPAVAKIVPGSWLRGVRRPPGT